MFFDQYPYTNMHNVNLDWVLQAVKSWGAMVEQNNQNFIDLNAANEAFKEYVTSYITNLDVQEEINNKLDQMLASGALTQYFAPYIKTDVEEWLKENLTPTTPPVDSTLSIPGAAADAKATGDAIRDINDNIGVAVENIENSLGGLYAAIGGDIEGFSTPNYALRRNGTFVADANSELMKYAVNEGDALYLHLSADNAGTFQWQNAPNVPSSVPSPVIIGTPVSGAVDNIYTVPEGATYLVVSQLKTNTTNIVVSASERVREIGNLEDLATSSQSTIVNAINEIVTGYADITNDIRYITGHSIQEDGTIIANASGRYTEFVHVSENDLCTIVLDNTSNQIQNVRFFGYDDDGEFIRQLLLSPIPASAQTTARITIPEDVTYMRVSIAVTVDLVSFTIRKSTDIEDRSGYLAVGSPYAYLSEFLDDAILDSTTCDTVYALYDAMVTDHPETFVRLQDIGTAAGNLPIRMYRMKWTDPVMVSVEASWNPANNIYNDSYDRYRHILITSGTHGNEKSSVYGVLLAIQEILDSDKEFAKYIRANFVLDIIPIVNPSGYNATTRNNIDGININRDFLTRQTTEAQAVYNVIVNGDYYACIDSHNSGGNANYIGITNTNGWKDEFIQIGIKFGQIFYNDWKQLTTGEQYAVAPYMQFWLNNSEGMLQDLFTDIGQLGYLIESVGVFKSANGVLTPNHQKYCKFTKDLLVNSIIALGSNTFKTI